VLEANTEKVQIQEEAAAAVRAKAAEVERVREAFAEEAACAEARRAAEIAALAEEAATEVARLKKTYAEKEARDAREKVEA
jgi:hypothetical protein